MGIELPRPACAFATLLLCLAGSCRQAETTAAPALMFPTLAEGQDRLDSLQLRGAGNSVLVTLSRKDGVWRVAERGGWPADAGLISQHLFVLSQTHLAEAKTADPGLYARLGVEPIAGVAATGTELTLAGGGHSSKLLIGKEHPKFDSNYVRVDGHAQSWLTDLPVGFDRDPAAWLDHWLIDLPLARVAQVQSSDGADPAFSLSHRDDRFRVDDAPSAAMHDSHQGDALAGALDHLRFDDLAVDDASAKVERSLKFTAVDGIVFELQVWHVGDRLWARVEASLDPDRAKAWARQSGRVVDLDGLGRRVADWNGKFHGRRFLMPVETATVLLLSHDDILAGTPTP
jgi:hypothetical protein